jgi:hypothetical protein
MPISHVCAKDLKFNKSQLRELDKWIKDILQLIDEKIEDSHNKGIFEIRYPLPSTFDIPNMSSVEARRKIHANIISDLACEERGFIVRYIKSELKYYVEVKWMSNEEFIQTEHEKHILKFYNLLPDERKKEINQPPVERYKGVKSLMLDVLDIV